MLELDDVKSEKIILRDSMERGVIVTSEMQISRKKTAGDCSDMIDRADDYVSFLKQRDHGMGPNDARPLKSKSAGEASRSIVEIVWEIGDIKEIKRSIYCLGRFIEGSDVSRAHGDVVTFIP